MGDRKGAPQTRREAPKLGTEEEGLNRDTPPTPKLGVGEGEPLPKLGMEERKPLLKLGIGERTCVHTPKL